MPCNTELGYLLAANEVWGKVMFLHLCVILFTVGGGGAGVSASREVCIEGGGWADTPHRILRDTVNERAVRILLKCNIV